jgi:hypothetical protein
VLVLDILLGLAVLALLIYRQLSSRPVNASALRLIAILLIIGLFQTFRVLRASTVRLWLQDGQPWSKGNWLTAALWIASLVAHLGYDFVVWRGPGVRGLGTATIVLYLAITLGFQRILVLQRAQRLQLGGPTSLGKLGGPG